jgi:hypothetical protein
MSLETNIVALAQVIGADVKDLNLKSTSAREDLDNVALELIQLPLIQSTVTDLQTELSIINTEIDSFEYKIFDCGNF